MRGVNFRVKSSKFRERNKGQGIGIRQFQSSKLNVYQSPFQEFNGVPQMNGDDPRASAVSRSIVKKGVG